MTYELSENLKTIPFVAHGAPTVVLGGIGMLMYPELLEPKGNPFNEKIHFSATLVYRKDLAQTNGCWAVVQAAIEAAVKKDVPSFTLAQLSTYPTFKQPYEDGATKLKKDAAKQSIPGSYQAGFGPDVFTIRAAANHDRKPKLLEANNTIITDPARVKELFYGGALVRAMFNVYAYGFAAGKPMPNKGVNFGLTALQFVHPGQKRYDGAPDVEAAFGAIPIEDMAGGFPAPGAAAAPAQAGGALFPASAPAAVGGLSAVGFGAPGNPY